MPEHSPPLDTAPKIELARIIVIQKVQTIFVLFVRAQLLNPEIQQLTNKVHTQI